MILYPAIDLKDGQCVRLLHGEMDKATVFGNDPAAQAATFEAAGCDWLHLVDLNGAFAGAPVNAAAVEAILSRVTVPCQLGGGIRDMATIEAWLASKPGMSLAISLERTMLLSRLPARSQWASTSQMPMPRACRRAMRCA